MKATLRKNGTKMFTIKVSFNVGRDALIAVVADAFRLDESRPKTRNDVLAIARKACHGNGWWLTAGNATAEDCDPEEERESAQKHATEIVDRLFPELVQK